MDCEQMHEVQVLECTLTTCGLAQRLSYQMRQLRGCWARLSLWTVGVDKGMRRKIDDFSRVDERADAVDWVQDVRQGRWNSVRGFMYSVEMIVVRQLRRRVASV